MKGDSDPSAKQKKDTMEGDVITTMFHTNTVGSFFCVFYEVGWAVYPAYVLFYCFVEF